VISGIINSLAADEITGNGRNRDREIEKGADFLEVT